MSDTEVIQCNLHSTEHLKYRQAWMNGAITDKGYVKNMTLISSDAFDYIEIEFFKPHEENSDE